MRKFYILLKKEVKELLTIQIILPLIITAVLFVFIGNVVGKQQEKTTGPVKINLIDQDKSNLSENVINLFNKNNIEVSVSSASVDNALENAKTENKTALLVIPKGFENYILAGQSKQIDVYTIIKNFSVFGGQNYANLLADIAKVNGILSNSLLSQKNPGIDPTALKNPLTPNEFIVVGSKQANVSPSAVMAFVSQQTMYIPIILFIVIVLSAQMIATAIANEKENKTLETLLTTPVSRNAIVVAKMAAASLIALLASVIYIFSFRSYINGLTGNISVSSDISAVIEKLGLSLSPQDYVLLGLSLFAGILIALSIALILGAFAEDVKSVAGLISPLMILVMIPYFFTLFLDLSALSPILRIIVYAIPFSHVFMTAPNLFLNDYPPVIYGIIYQLVWFAVLVGIASKIFSTDKIMTMKLNFKKKSLFSK